jgi:hypothetical protein
MVLFGLVGVGFAPCCQRGVEYQGFLDIAGDGGLITAAGKSIRLSLRPLGG